MRDRKPMPPLDKDGPLEKSMFPPEIPAPSQHNMSNGWLCPVCGSVYAIWVSKCSVCGPKTTTALTDGQFTKFFEEWLSF